ncbi:hypothetical protein WJX72_001835 [[Myrmecia] bisecta]|uniref:Uncharacterized protein n=1 Tax=[Myrmecia] bisecta TaxID=41462 RepID=A0AAW1PN45_9CHLO
MSLLTPGRRPAASGVKAEARTGRAADNELDIAVFRFTLGIPGFDDALVPRVVGLLGAVLLLLNNVFGPVPSGAQARAEALGALLAAMCMATPAVERRLKELQPGRGRTAANSKSAGANNIFAISQGVNEQLKQELAWASYALLRNTNTSGLLIYHAGTLLMARGAMGPAAASDASSSQAGPSLAALAMEVQRATEQSADIAAVLEGRASSFYLPDQGSLIKGGAAQWHFVPRAAQSLLVQRMEPGSASWGRQSAGLLLLMAERPRAWSARERAWAAAIARKLSLQVQETGPMLPA